MLIIDGLIIDAEVSSDHTFEAEVTDHPVEKGADVTDHNRPRPIVVTVEGIVSATPLGTLRTSREGTDPPADALAVLQQIRDDREPVKISTSLQDYENMMMQRLQITKDASTGRALRFSATFKQVIIAINERTVKRAATPSAKGETDLGNKPATPVTTTPPKAPSVDTKRPPVRRIYGPKQPVEEVGGTVFAPPGRVYVASGDSGVPRRLGRESPL